MFRKKLAALTVGWCPPGRVGVRGPRHGAFQGGVCEPRGLTTTGPKPSANGVVALELEGGQVEVADEVGGLQVGGAEPALIQRDLAHGVLLVGEDACPLLQPKHVRSKFSFRGLFGDPGDVECPGAGGGVGRN